MSEVKQYAQRDIMELDEAGNHYIRHIDHMTREKLHSKSDIAAELGWRDMQIAELKAQRDALAAENAYLRGEIKQHSQSTHFCEVCGEDDPCANDDVCYVLNHKLPATKEILNDLVADSIENLIAVLDESGAFTIADAITVIENFSAQLRTGEPS